MEQAPSITHLAWGEVTVSGHGTFKDVKVWPGGARAWDWTETGTRHRPGVQMADVQEILDHGAAVLVLTRGVDGKLQVPDEVVADLEARGVEVVVALRPEAVEVFNARAAASEPVGLLLHSTC